MPNSANLRKFISQFKNKRILVVGDVMLDQHIQGTVSRISPEAPVPIVLQQGQPSFAPGGAANVANNLRSLGADVVLVGKVGRDPEGKFLLQGLKDNGIATTGIFVDHVPTILKIRIVAHHQQVLRLDREDLQKKTSGELTKKILRFLQAEVKNFDAVILSDYGKGMVTPQLIEEVCSLSQKYQKILTIDPKVENFAYYRKVTSITPNRREAENAIRNIKISQAGAQLDIHTDHLETLADVERAGRELLKFLELESLLITLGEQGMYLFEDNQATHIPTKAKEVFDVTGAGDTVIATFTLALTAGAKKLQAADLANSAAGIVVGHMGAVTVNSKRLKEAVS